MCEVMCVAMFIVYLVNGGRVGSAVLFASVGFALAGGLYRIGRGIEKVFGKKDAGETSDSGVA